MKWAAPVAAVLAACTTSAQKPDERPRSRSAPDAGDVAHFPPRPRLRLAVEVEMGLGLAQYLVPSIGFVADQVDHLHPRAGKAGVAQWQAADGADVVLELRG